MILSSAHQVGEQHQYLTEMKAMGLSSKETNLAPRPATKQAGLAKSA